MTDEKLGEGQPFRVRYDALADAAYIYLKDIPPGGVAWTHNELVGERRYMINLDFDKENRLIGIEVIDARTVLPPEVLKVANRR